MPATAGAFLAAPAFAKGTAARNLALSTAQTEADMGAPVELETVPNGAIAKKWLLHGIDEAAWTEPTIEQPAKGTRLFGGYGLCPNGHDRHR
jgi:hypothetical protein